MIGCILRGVSGAFPHGVRQVHSTYFMVGEVSLHQKGGALPEDNPLSEEKKRGAEL
jgi:hypothetical protein